MCFHPIFVLRFSKEHGVSSSQHRWLMAPKLLAIDHFKMLQEYFMSSKDSHSDPLLEGAADVGQVYPLKLNFAWLISPCSIYKVIFCYIFKLNKHTRNGNCKKQWWEQEVVISLKNQISRWGRLYRRDIRGDDWDCNIWIIVKVIQSQWKLKGVPEKENWLLLPLLL